MKGRCSLDKIELFLDQLKQQSRNRIVSVAILRSGAGPSVDITVVSRVGHLN